MPDEINQIRTNFGDMKKPPKKQPVPESTEKTNFRLIKNENWRPRPMPKVKVKVKLPDDELPPAA